MQCVRQQGRFTFRISVLLVGTHCRNAISADVIETAFGDRHRQYALLLLDPRREGTEDQKNGGFVAQCNRGGGPYFGMQLRSGDFSPPDLSVYEILSADFVRRVLH